MRYRCRAGRGHRRFSSLQRHWLRAAEARRPAADRPLFPVSV